MKITNIYNRQTVTDLKAAYNQCKTFSKMGGQSKDRASWLISYYQVKVLKGYKPNEVKVYDRIGLKNKQAQLEFNDNWDNPQARNLNFVGAGCLSKGASNRRKQLNNKLFKSAIESCKLKLIHKIINWAGDGLIDNSLRSEIVMDISSNKDIADDYDYSYWHKFDTPLIQIHADIILWCDRYAPKYATDLIGYHIAKYWLKYK